MEELVRVNKSHTACCVPNCKKVGYFVENGKKVSFHKFPKNQELRNVWVSKIRRDIGETFKIGEHTKVCSRHFSDGDFRVTVTGKRFLKEKSFPTIFPWRPMKTPRTSTYTKRHEMITPVSSLKDVETNASKTKSLETPTEKDRLHELEVKVLELSKRLSEQQDALKLCEKEKEHLANCLSGLKSNEPPKLEISVENIKSSNENISFYTGFPTYLAFQQCLTFLNPGVNGQNIIYYDSKVSDEKKTSRARKLDIEDEYLMTLMRLRLGLFEQDLAYRFKIGKTTVHRIVVSWINFMFLRLGSLPVWPTKQAIQMSMPETFKEKFPQAEWIIDAFEIQTERPSSLSLASQSYSSYKSRNTLKGLIAYHQAR